MPAEVSASTALSRARLAEPPRDMDTTEGLPLATAWVITQSSPETLESVITSDDSREQQRLTYMSDVEP
jgi:hypothetical protein